MFCFLGGWWGYHERSPCSVHSRRRFSYGGVWCYSVPCRVLLCKQTFRLVSLGLFSRLVLAPGLPQPHLLCFYHRMWSLATSAQLILESDSLTASHCVIISNMWFVLQRTTLALTSARQFIFVRQFLHDNTHTLFMLFFTSPMCAANSGIKPNQ